MITYITTKKVTLNTSRHTLFLANTPTLRLLILIPSRTHSQSQQKHKRNLFHRVQGLHLFKEDNLKSIQVESYSTNFDQSQTFSNLSSLKNSKTLAKNLSKIFSQICFSEFIQRCSLLSNLNKLLIAFKDWSKHLKLERNQLKHLMLSQSTKQFFVMVPKQTIGCFLESIGC